MANMKHGNDFPNSIFNHEKVLIMDFFGDQSLPLTFKNRYLLVLSNVGQLMGFRPVELFEGSSYHHEIQSIGISSYNSTNNHTFDDIIQFKGITYVLDHLGKLYQMCRNTFGELQVMVDKPIVMAHDAINIYRKRLVGSPWDEELYLVVRNDLEDVLDVYKLYKKSLWIKVKTFVGEQLLVLCRNHGFFTPASEFPDYMPLQNCIFFLYDSFTRRLDTRGRRPFKKQKGESEIHVFWLGVHNQNFKPISSYPRSPAINLFSPPKWFTSTYGTYFKSEPEEDVLMEPSPQSQVSTPQCEKQSIENPWTSSAQIKSTSNLPPGSGSIDRNEQDFSEEKVYNANSTPETCSIVKFKGTYSSVQFQGIEIKSEFLATLQAIWDKHGNLIRDMNVFSKDMRTCALESMAKLVKTLENTTRRSLTNSQAEDIKSTMSDLKHKGMKVDWLVPTVEKALKVQKNRALIESRIVLEEKKARIEKEEKEFLARTTKVKQQLEEDLACLCAMVPFPDHIDLYQSLGEGLLF